MMIGALSKGLNQKPAMIKGVFPATPFRAFALWLVLLFLYFLLLPSAAETLDRGAEYSASDSHTVNVVSWHRDDASAPRR